MATTRSAVRLAALYSVIERMRSLELRDSTAAVNDVLTSSAMARASREHEISNGRHAMEDGCKEAWQVAEVTRAAIETRLFWLARIRVERESAMRQAADQYRASKLRVEQMNAVVDRARLHAAARASKEAQSQADDRFASRGASIKSQESETRE